MDYAAIGGSIGSWLGGSFGALAAALLAVPVAACVQIVVRELWKLTEVDAEAEADSPEMERS